MPVHKWDLLLVSSRSNLWTGSQLSSFINPMNTAVADILVMMWMLRSGKWWPDAGADTVGLEGAAKKWSACTVFGDRGDCNVVYGGWWYHVEQIAECGTASRRKFVVLRLLALRSLKFVRSSPRHPLGVLEHSSSCCCSNPNEGLLLFCISAYSMLVDVLTHAVDLHKTASR